ncbi:MAG: hypothetical protein V4819_18395 [Verrucomicrobiota bacterium]
MRLSQFSIISVAVLVGLVLGLILAPSLRQTGPAIASPPQGKSAATNRTSAITDAPGNSPSRIRVKDREPAKKPDEPRISIPVKSAVALLREGHLGSVDFKVLEHVVGRPLEALGASKTESEEVRELIKKSKDEVNAAEKTHFKLGLVTPNHIEIDASGIREPISAIIGRLQNGIHATLDPQTAEVLVSVINWEKYYPTDRKVVASLEIKRNRAGELTAWEQASNDEMDEWSTGQRIDKKFPDDGTPLPADQFFSERWRPYLKGLTLVPKDEK